MIKNEAQAVLKDIRENEDNTLILQVNFDDAYKDCVKISLGTSEIIVTYSDLFSFMFTLGTKEQQAKMIPVREELGNQYMKQIQVRLKKDMKEGEMMAVNVPVNVPAIVEEQIKYELSQKETGTITPYLTEKK